MDAKLLDSGRSAMGEWLSPGRFALVLGALLFAAFPQIILGTQAFFYRDYGVLGYPFVFHHRESFWAGEIPLWNPLSNCGAPFLAQWGTMVLYPPSLFYVLLPLPWSLGFFCLSHLFLAGMGMFMLAHRWTGSRLAAGVAGLAFVFNSATQSCLMWPNYTVALGWMPWVVWSVERAWAFGGGRRLALATMMTTLQLLAGVPELVALTWLLLGGLWILEFFGGRIRRRDLIWRSTVMVALSAGLIAAQLLPFLDLLSQSQRSTGFAASKWALPAWGFANLLIPSFHTGETLHGTWIQADQDFLTSYYLGVPMLVLAAAAGWVKRDLRVGLLGFLAVLCFGLALGDNGIVYPFVKQLVPALGLARYPIKFVLLAAFIVPLLAAFTVAHWDRADSRPSATSLVCVAGIACALMAWVVWSAANHPYQNAAWGPDGNLLYAAQERSMTRRDALAGFLSLAGVLGMLITVPRLATPRSRILAQAALLAVIFLDAWAHTPVLNPTLPSEIFAPDLTASRRSPPPPKLGEGRVMISPRAEASLLHYPSTNSLGDFALKRYALWSNLNLLEGAPKVNGSSTMRLREEAELENLIYGGSNTVSSGLADFLGAVRVSHPEQPGRWITRTNACPLVTAGQQVVFAGHEITLAALCDSGFDPRTVVFLPPEAQATIITTNRVGAAVTGEKFGAHRIEFDVDTPAGTVAVVAQTFHPAWQAEIDGIISPLFRANHAFQALPVPAGRHHVLLEYRDAQFRLGILLSSLAALLWMALIFVPDRQRCQNHG